MISLDELKKQIEARTDIPAYLLTGTTAEELLDQARSILKFKQESALKEPKATRDLFAEWHNSQVGDPEPEDAAEVALSEFAEQLRIENGGYPMVKDGGQVSTENMPDPRPTREQFGEWFYHQTAFNPFKN